MTDVVSPTSIPDDPERSWVRSELGTLHLGDGRLDRRAVSILEAFTANPNVSIPQASGTWAATKAVYRFINNDKVADEKILAAHRAATLSRSNGSRIILAVQDTTELNYTGHPSTEGLGTIGSSSTLRGMHVHTTMAFTPSRVPLGIMAQHTWIRPVEEFKKKETRRDRPIEEKESYKWIKSLMATETAQEANPDVTFVNVGDREADIYDLFKVASEFKTKLLVRGSWNRCVDHEEGHLYSYLEAQPVAAELKMRIPQKRSKKKSKSSKGVGKPTRKLRTARLELRFAPVSVCAPRERKKNEGPVQLYAVYLHEPDPPEGYERLSWLLLTTLEIRDVEEAMTAVEYYAVRWSIEVFHRVLKSGCRIEERQLKSAKGLRVCLALDSLVAWRIQFLTMIGRDTPDLPCDVVFEEYEWKSLFCYVNRTTTPPETPPRLGEMVLLIARLGGFLARKSDGHPGMKSLWYGLQKVNTISSAWFAFGPGKPPP